MLANQLFKVFSGIVMWSWHTKSGEMKSALASFKLFLVTLRVEGSWLMLSQVTASTASRAASGRILSSCNSWRTEQECSWGTASAPDRVYRPAGYYHEPCSQCNLFSLPLRPASHPLLPIYTFFLLSILECKKVPGICKLSEMLPLSCFPKTEGENRFFLYQRRNLLPDLSPEGLN